MKKILALIIWIILFQLIGYGIGSLTQANIASWYQTLQKSSLTPPEIVFPIVWSVLYVLLAVVGWLIWQNKKDPRRTTLFVLYVIGMVMNWAWTPVFFQWHWIQLGFYWIVTMILITVITILAALRNNKLVAFLLSLYSLWLIFAAYLNWVIWIKN